MTKGLELGTRAGARARGFLLQISLAALLASALACKDEPAPAPGQGGTQGDGDGDGDASIEGGAGVAAGDGDGDGDASVDPQAGAGGEGGEGGAGNSGAGGNGGSAGEDPDGGSGSGGDGDGDGDAQAGTSGGDGDGDGDGPQDAVCFAGGDDADASGSGSCAEPFAIDMSDLEYGDVVFHETGSAQTDGAPPSIGKCGENTERDIVFTVIVPSDADLEVTVDSTDDADPTILVQEGPDDTCDKKDATECVDDHGAAGCEYLRIHTGTGAYDSNTPQVVISEHSASDTSFTVRFRLMDPGGGS